MGRAKPSYSDLDDAGYAWKPDIDNRLHPEMYRVDELVAMVHRVLSGLSSDESDADYPLDFSGKNSVQFYTPNFYGHLNYQLG